MVNYYVNGGFVEALEIVITRDEISFDGVGNSKFDRSIRKIFDNFTKLIGLFAIFSISVKFFFVKQQKNGRYVTACRSIA